MNVSFVFVSVNLNDARIRANSTIEQFILGVDPAVVDEMLRRCKTFAANITNVRLFVILGMHGRNVSLEIFLVSEHLRTMFALGRFAVIARYVNA